MGQMPSRLGYQPTMGTELSGLEERIANTDTGAITSIQAVYVPADDFTDPAAVHTFSHLSASIVLSRKRASEGLFPAIDPLQSSSKMATPGIVGERHYGLAQEIRRTLAQYAELKDIIAMLGLEQLSPEDRNVVARARRLERFLTQPFFTTEQFTGLKGKLVSLKDALDGCERILRDEFKDYPESALYMIGTIGEAKGKAKPDPSAAPAKPESKPAAEARIRSMPPGCRPKPRPSRSRIPARNLNRRSNMPPTPMNLKVLLPFQIFAEKTGVSRIVAETREGSFGLLPHRLDCVAALAPGILTYETESDGEVFVAVDEGVLVKTGPDVLVSVRRALGGTDLGQLREAVEREFLTLDEHEQSVRSVMAKMEGGSHPSHGDAFTMTDEPQSKLVKPKPSLSRGGRREGGAQAQGAAQLRAGRLVRPGDDGADRLVGGGSDAARRGARYLVGQTPSGQACLDAGAVGGRARDRLFECVALGGQGRQGDAGRTGG